MDTPTALPPPRLSRPATALVVIATFLAISTLGIEAFRAVATALDLQGAARIAVLALLGYGPYLYGPMLVAAMLFGRRHVFAALGLRAPFWPAVAFALACTAIVLAWIALNATPLPPDRMAYEIARGALLPGFAEEVLFRAFLFGFLFRFCGWGFLPAALLSSLVFGLEHVYQGDDLQQALAIALLTAIGGVWWSWLYVEWRWNAWVPIAFHVLMNAYWSAFDVADNALGETMSVVVRVVCIVISIVATLTVAQRRSWRQLAGRRWWRSAP